MGLNIRKMKLQMFTVVSLDGRIVDYFYFSLYIFYFISPHVCKKVCFVKKRKQTRKALNKYHAKILPLLFGKAKRLKEPLLMSLLSLWDDRQAEPVGWGGGRPPPPSHSPAIGPAGHPDSSTGNPPSGRQMRTYGTYSSCFYREGTSGK